MSINLSNINNLELFVADNIIEINNNISNFTFKKLVSNFPAGQQIDYTETDIVPFLSDKFKEFLVNNKTSFEKELHNISGNTITDIELILKNIANEKIFLYKDVLNYYEDTILKNIQTTYFNNNNFKKSIYERILTYNQYTQIKNSDSQIRYIKNKLKKLIDHSLYIGLMNGYTRNMTNINTGTKNANEGDSAQFLFLARAILAGFNCSNVDVRSSRYDAIIDYNNRLLRVQIKGISGTSILLKDRDRGGAGNDTNTPRNQGRFISSADSDIYVAVDKQFGICYLIPTSVIDAFVLSGKSTIPINSLEQYKENWTIVSQVVSNLYS